MRFVSPPQAPGPLPDPRPGLRELFGIRGGRQVLRDYGQVFSRQAGGNGFLIDPGTLGLLRPDLSLPAYVGRVPADGLAPIFNFYDRVGGGLGYHNVVTRRACRDWRGGRLSYDEHDGTDFVIPPLTPLGAAAPGVLAAVRDCWLRGGLTAIVDHGHGVVTQYSHLARVRVAVGTPLSRGEVLGWSGVSGAEMTTFCPWVPPHLHFMVWVHGRPVDPFSLQASALGYPTWWPDGEPQPADGPLPGDPAPPTLDDIGVDPGHLDDWMARCDEPAVWREIRALGHPVSRQAVLEDSLHHDRRAWPTGNGTPLPRLRPAPRGDAPLVWLTLPLPADRYRGARPADTRFTRP